MHTVPFRLSKPAHIFQTSDSTGFSIRCGVKVKDPKTKADSWTNFQATVFAKSIPQIEYYTRTLVEGAMAVVSGQSIFVDVYQGNNGQSITLTLLGAHIDAIAFNEPKPDAAQPRNQQSQPQMASHRVTSNPAHPNPYHPANSGQQTPQQPAGFDSFFDDELPNF